MLHTNTGPISSRAAILHNTELVLNYSSTDKNITLCTSAAMAICKLPLTVPSISWKVGTLTARLMNKGICAGGKAKLLPCAQHLLVRDNTA